MEAFELQALIFFWRGWALDGLGVSVEDDLPPAGSPTEADEDRLPTEIAGPPAPSFSRPPSAPPRACWEGTGAGVRAEEVGPAGEAAGGQSGEEHSGVLALKATVSFDAHVETAPGPSKTGMSHQTAAGRRDPMAVWFLRAGIVWWVGGQADSSSWRRRPRSDRRVSPTITVEQRASDVVSTTDTPSANGAHSAALRRRALVADETSAAAAAAAAAVAVRRAQTRRRPSVSGLSIRRKQSPFLEKDSWGSCSDFSKKSQWGQVRNRAQLRRSASALSLRPKLKRSITMAGRLIPMYPLKVQPAGEWIPLGRRAKNCLKKHPLTRWYFRTCDSVVFWRIYPWVFAGIILFFANFFTLIFSVKYIAFDDAMMLSFLTTYAMALTLQFCCLDVMLIVVRNNVSWMRKRLATKRYQVIEKFVIAPIYGIVNKLIFNFNKFFGC